MSGHSTNKARKVRIISYLPEVLTLLVCAVLLLGNVNEKQGFHMDELLSFELANAEFNPWIVPTQPQGRLAKFVENELRGETLGETLGNLADTVKDVLENRGSSKLLTYTADVYEEPVWIDNETFEDYVTVGEEDGFSYLSVYFNVKDDNHPPLHFMVLHTVSSLFRGEVTPFMGCVINLICVLGIMVLLMYISRQLMKIWGVPEWGKYAGLLTAGLYGLSVGAVSTTLLIRMYAMVTFFCVATLAIHVRKLYSYLLGGSDFTERNKLLILVTVLGFWTQYFFLFYCLILSAVTAVILWRQKRRDGLWCYIRSMVTAAVIGVVVYPFSVGHVFSSGRGVEALENLSAGLRGFGSRLFAFAEILCREIGWALVLLPMVVVVMVAVVWKRNVKSGTGEGLQWLLWIPVVGYFLMASRMSPYLVNRYIMPLFPLVILVLSVTVCHGIGVMGLKEKWLRATKILAAVLALVLAGGQLMNVLRYESDYLYAGYEAQEELAEAYNNYPCICVYQGVGYYENLLEFVQYDKTLLVTEEELANRADVESVASLAQVVVLVKGGLDDANICKILEERYGLYTAEVLMDGSAPYGDTLLVMERR